MVEQKHTSFSLEGLLKQVADQKFPPVEKWNPDYCGTIDMRIASDGTWFYMGTPIARQRMVKLFASVLRKDDDGETYLVTPVEKIGITVDDAHFVVISVDQLDGGDLIFTTNVGDKIKLGSDNPLWVDINETTYEPRPYVRVRGRLDALLSRSVFYELVELAEEQIVDGKNTLVLKVGNVSYSLGSLEAGDA